MTVNEMAAFLRVHPTTIYRLIRNRSLPVFRVGSEWRCLRERLEEWAQATAVDPLSLQETPQLSRRSSKNSSDGQ